MSARTQGGFTLVEVLLVMTIGLVLLGGTLMSFDAFNRRHKQTETLNDSAQAARNGMDNAARQLRNLANQDPSQQTTTIAVAQPYDLVFQTSDPSRKWVRYCLDVTGAGGSQASSSRGQLWMAETDTGAAPNAGMLASCPGSGWAARRVVADHLTNRMAGRNFGVFTYACKASAPAGCPASTADFARITNIGAQLYVDPNPGRAPSELRVVSGVYLRNQNETPVADFTWTQVTGTPRTVILNASRSSDPEGRTMLYDWFYGSTPVQLTPEEACATEIKQKANNSTLFYLGQGVTFRYQRPVTIGSPMNIQLVVRDPGCLYDTEVKAVTIP
jgi:prepilin-type N-terminal cleavage/methylation domain-containing protein